VRDTFKYKFRLKDYYYSIVLSLPAIIRIIGNQIKPKIDDKFIERLMLAVTEVNGCEICSYAHTKMALKKGFSQEEINCFLSASDAYIVPHESKAILFAQHYADSLGRPDKDAYKAIFEEYGKVKTKVIVAAIQVMMMANIGGIPFSAFSSRLKKRPYKNSSLFYELGMLMSIIFIFPLALVHTMLRLLTFRSNIRFSKVKD